MTDKQLSGKTLGQELRHRWYQRTQVSSRRAGLAWYALPKKRNTCSRLLLDLSVNNTKAALFCRAPLNDLSNSCLILKSSKLYVAYQPNCIAKPCISQMNSYSSHKEGEQHTNTAHQMQYWQQCVQFTNVFYDNMEHAECYMTLQVSS